MTKAEKEIGIVLRAVWLARMETSLSGSWFEYCRYLNYALFEELLND